VVDYSKFKYEQKKKQKEIKSRTQKVVIKEIRFGPNTEEHDFNFKVKHSTNFLQEGSKVKATVRFYGRYIVFKERGEILLLRFAQALEDYGKVEQMPKLEGKRMSILLTPKAVTKK
jgi:translation initiation factor IF-3